MVSSLFVISGNFSGAGKTTILEAALRRFPKAKKVITCTTRLPRAHLGEKDGVHYRFLTKTEFSRRLAANEFAEYKQGFAVGNWYGILHEDIRNSVTGKIPAFLVVELQGVRTLQENYPTAHYVFISANADEIRKRLLKRGESSEDVEKRMDIINKEQKLLKKVRIDRTIPNSDGALDKAVEDFCAFVLLQTMKNVQGRAKTNS